MSYFKGKPVDPAHPGGLVKANQRTEDDGWLVGLKNVNGKEKSLYQTKRVTIKTTEEYKNRGVKVEYTFWGRR